MVGGFVLPDLEQWWELAQSGSQVWRLLRTQVSAQLVGTAVGLQTCGSLGVRNCRQMNTTNSRLLRTCENENLMEIKTFKSSCLSGELHTRSLREDADPEKVWEDPGAFKLGWLMKGSPCRKPVSKDWQRQLLFQMPKSQQKPGRHTKEKQAMAP